LPAAGPGRRTVEADVSGDRSGPRHGRPGAGAGVRPTGTLYSLVFDLLWSMH